MSHPPPKRHKAEVLLDPQDYTVGWICALPKEFLAARAFLDEKHEKPKQAQNDTNNYAFGKMREHNIVITVLTKSRYGTTSAATVARDMVHSFPNIRVGLMVGIGGGAPRSNHDIRLGDVVVSCCDGGVGGILPYDHGKAIQDQPFLETAVMNQPPDLLLKAVAGLETDYNMEGHRLNEDVELALTNIKTKRDFRRPAATTDRLYKSDFLHQGHPSAECGEACGDEYLISRRERDEEEHDPAIHYGIIASANTLMKDAHFRDNMARDRGVLCFEMEAAGLMNHFPCLVIRGICDYSDTHKNKDWQGFAAMVAAAYAKDVLGSISPANVENARRLEEDLRSVKETLDRQTKEVASIMDQTGEVHDMFTESQRREISKWLECTDPSPIHNRNHDLYEPETGTWVKRSEQWAKWLAGETRCLWLSGMAGAGKTVLMSHLIEETKQHCKQLEDEKITWVYYYCHYTHGQDEARPFLRWIISQLCRRSGFIPDSVHAMYKTGTQPSLTELLNALESILLQLSRVYILLDALDESATPRDDLLKVLEKLATDFRFGKIQIIASSRCDYVDIERTMNKVYSSILMENALVEDDIRTYVRSKLASDPKFQRWPRNILAEVERTLPKKAAGMFRLAVCQIHAIQQLQPDYNNVQRALATLPRTLDDMYSRVLRAIDEEDRLFVTHVLHWIYFHTEVWKVEEGKDAIPSPILLQATDLSTSNAELYPKAYGYNEETLRELCGCLIAVGKDEIASDTSDEDISKEDPAKDNESTRPNRVQFAHYTVLEYLMSPRVTAGPNSMFAIHKRILHHDLPRAILHEVHHVNSKVIKDLDFDVEQLLSKDIHCWCTVTAVALLTSVSWQRRLSRHADLQELAFGMLRPSRPGYSSFCLLLRKLGEHKTLFTPFPLVNLFRTLNRSLLFRVEWMSTKGCDEVAILLNLLCLSPRPDEEERMRQFENGEVSLLIFPLAEALIRQTKNSDVLLRKVSLRSGVGIWTTDGLGSWGIWTTEGLGSWPWERQVPKRMHEVNGTIIEIAAQLDWHSVNRDVISFLIDRGAGSFDPSRILHLFSGVLSPSNLIAPPEALISLLRLGADPNLKGYRLTPLQVAAARLDHVEVKILLAHGADPSGVGSENGISCNDGSVAHQCNQEILDLYDVEPLDICRRARGWVVWLAEDELNIQQARVEDLLLGFFFD